MRGIGASRQEHVLGGAEDTAASHEAITVHTGLAESCYAH